MRNICSFKLMETYNTNVPHAVGNVIRYMSVPIPLLLSHSDHHPCFFFYLISSALLVELVGFRWNGKDLIFQCASVLLR